MDGVELAARFSYQPNRLRYCGPRDANKLFLDYVKRGRNKARVIAAIKRFEAAYPYLQLIARKNKANPFDYDVVEAYWIGNPLLNKITRSDVKKHILGLAKRGLPKSFAQALAKKVAPGLLPSHFFHVTFVGVGMLTGKVKATLDSMETCRISADVVVKVTKQKLVVSHAPLKVKKNKFYTGKPIKRTVEYNRDFIPKAKAGDTVAVHWGFAVMRLSVEQVYSLRNYTEQNMKILNGLQFSETHRHS
jgi:hypothetical protein